MLLIKLQNYVPPKSLLISSPKKFYRKENVKMNFLLPFLLMIVFVVPIFSQGYYPLKIGNVWQYRDSYDSTYGWTHTTIKDTIMPNGLTYTKLIGDNPGSYDDGYYRQDSSKVFYYGRYPTSDTTYQDYEKLRFDFSKITGDTVRITIQKNPPDTIMVRVIDDRMLNVFGKLRRTWLFYETSKRTSGYALHRVADSVGMIYTAGEGGIAFSLVGTIINGNKYGIITHVEDSPPSIPNKRGLI